MVTQGPLIIAHESYDLGTNSHKRIIREAAERYAGAHPGRELRLVEVNTHKGETFAGKIAEKVDDARPSTIVALASANNFFAAPWDREGRQEPKHKQAVEAREDQFREFRNAGHHVSHAEMARLHDHHEASVGDQSLAQLLEARSADDLPPQLNYNEWSLDGPAQRHNVSNRVYNYIRAVEAASMDQPRH